MLPPGESEMSFGRNPATTKGHSRTPALFYFRFGSALPSCLPASSLIAAPQDQARVLTAESQRVREYRPHSRATSNVRNVVKIAFRIRVVQINSRWNDTV